MQHLNARTRAQIKQFLAQYAHVQSAFAHEGITSIAHAAVHCLTEGEGDEHTLVSVNELAHWNAQDASTSVLSCNYIGVQAYEQLQQIANAADFYTCLSNVYNYVYKQLNIA